MPRPPPERRLGLSIRRARKASGLTQAVASEAAGMSPESWSRIERGKLTPSVPALIRMAKALDATLDELVGGKIAERDAALRPAERRLVAAVADLLEPDVDAITKAISVLRGGRPSDLPRSRT
jgi:transcriptional regulator with XRE-family HTH domain